MNKGYNRVWFGGIILLADILLSWILFYIDWNAWISIPEFFVATVYSPRDIV